MADREIPWLWIGLGALLLAGGGVAYVATRGIRNNNPGNVTAGSPWVGSTGSDGTFATFSSPVYGIRAMTITLNNYVNNDGVPSTVQGLISRYSATDQPAYIANVSAALGVSPTDTIDLSNPQTMQTLLGAMITQENGVNPYSDATIQQGIALAG